MFVGHFALGYAAKRAEPRLSLAVLIGAAQFADVLWPALVALGLERVRLDPGNTAVTPLDFVSYPYSHSLLLLAVWGVLFGLLVRARVRRSRAFVVVFSLVVSHWFSTSSRIDRTCRFIQEARSWGSGSGIRYGAPPSSSWACTLLVCGCTGG